MSRVSAAMAAVGLTILVSGADLTDVQFELLAVEDSSTYYLYRYHLINPSSSTWGLTAAAMDVSASSATLPALPATGDFRDWTADRTDPPAHAQVGPIVPSGWRGSLSVTAELDWYVPVGGLTSSDSLSPGDTLSGLGIRSSYLPGLRQMMYSPTVEACCTEPVDTTEEALLPFTWERAVPGWSVGPRYLPSEVNVDVLASQLDAVCDDPLWITDRALCAELGQALAMSQTQLAAGDHTGATVWLDSVREQLRLHRADPSLHTNAYWMLTLNVEAARNTITRQERARQVMRPDG